MQYDNQPLFLLLIDFNFLENLLCKRRRFCSQHVHPSSSGYMLAFNSSAISHFFTDLTNFRSISVDLEDETAWVQSGAIVRELYYSIAKSGGLLGFPSEYARVPTVGIDGHFSGREFGTMLRKYGLAADTIIDAYFVDVNVRILDRVTMGEELFCASLSEGVVS